MKTWWNFDVKNANTNSDSWFQLYLKTFANANPPREY